ncbi:MAG TPA: SPOR domain-containing protein [Thermoanaerobaculia bacterium]|nr:SPOR domain-containing protein [Thermoanaerobaculia bacterium]
MPEPPTHYQLSFTVRQAMVLFIGLLLALGAAYFLGLLTGMAGREQARPATEAAAATPSPTEPARIAALAPSPTAIRPPSSSPIPPFPKPVLGKEPTGKPTIQFFEDGSESEPTPSRQAVRSPPPRAASPAAAEAGEFWVQVTSVTSEREARTRRDKLVHRGYHARVETVEGPKGSVYRVRVGPYRSRADAERASERLTREEKVKTWIAPAGK